MQVEYATDVVFRQQAKFQLLYAAIVRTPVHVVKTVAQRRIAPRSGAPTEPGGIEASVTGFCQPCLLRLTLAAVLPWPRMRADRCPFTARLNGR
jgi:hypothetical protein